MLRLRVPSSSRIPLGVVAVAVVLLGTATTAHAEDPATDFKQACYSCHTIGGGPLTGPDLKNVHERRDRAWLVNFIVDPGAVLDSGDPYAAQLLIDAGNVRMPNVAGMSKARANGLLDLIEAESKLEKSRFQGLQLSTRPFTPEDVALGRALFLGTEELTAGGTACIACHTVGGLSGLGGGRLGPDLTHVYERYENRRKLGTWLFAPATETMLPTFREHPLEESEILPLVAFFEHTMQTEQEADGSNVLLFVLLGLGGAVGAVLLLNWIWKGRFRAVRSPLVRAAALPGDTAGAVKNA